MAAAVAGHHNLTKHTQIPYTYYENYGTQQKRSDMASYILLSNGEASSIFFSIPVALLFILYLIDAAVPGLLLFDLFCVCVFVCVCLCVCVCCVLIHTVLFNKRVSRNKKKMKECSSKNIEKRYLTHVVIMQKIIT